MRNVSTYFTCTFSHINLFFIFIFHILYFIFHFSLFIFERCFSIFPFLFLLMRICSGNLSSLLLSSLCLWHVQFWVNLTSKYTLYKTALPSSIFYFHLFAALQYRILNLIAFLPVTTLAMKERSRIRRKTQQNTNTYPSL
jgi:hypothetical protein